MLEGLRYFAQGLIGFLNVQTLFNVLWATQLGIIVGMLPGLTATMGVALMTTLTFRLSASNAVLILICMYIGAIYGGSRSAILLNIPGTPANAATCMEGYPLARQGRAGRAIGIATSGSFLGTIVGMLMLAFLTPLLGSAALKFQSFEFSWLALFGIIISGSLTAPKDPMKGWIAGFLGLFFSMVGMGSIHAYVRFSFGSTALAGGISLIPAMVGAFGFAELLYVMKHPVYEVITTKIERVVPKISEIFQHWKTIIRSGLVGTFIGAVPGVGEDVSAWVSYDLARRSSKHPETYGTGNVEGLMAAETGNNACVAGAMIPVLSLAIPGSAPAAVLLAAMMIHGVRPGPLIMIQFPQFVFQVVAMVLLASVAMLVLGLSMVRLLVKVLLVPRTKLMPIVFTLCVVGSYALSDRLFDVGTMVVFGVLGYYMREMDYPMPPLVLGLILGPILDSNLRRALVLSNGSLLPFFTRPVSLVLFLIIVFVMVSRTRWFGSALSSARGAIRRAFQRGDSSGKV